MTRLAFPSSRPRRARTAAVVLALCLLGVAVAPATAAARQAPDPAAAAAQVTAAEQRAAEMRGARARTRTALDDAVAAYEHAYAHRLRLEQDLADIETAREEADRAGSAAVAAFRLRVGSAYRHPTAGLAVADAVLQSADTASALHRAVLWRRMAAGGADALRSTAALQRAVDQDATAVHVVTAGATGAAEQWRRTADALDAQLAADTAAGRAADGRVRDAREAQTRAEAAAREAARRAAAAAAAASAAAAPSPASPASAGLPAAPVAPALPPPTTGGKVCPVGTPNGFIDSWGFPRSGGRTHQGVDIFAAYGTPLYAVADGSILRVYTNPLGGLAINLVDDDGTMYYYAHLSSASVSSGQRVAAGDVIGAVGTSGNARGTPPHLHWQHHPGGGAAINPFPLAAALCR